MIISTMEVKLKLKFSLLTIIKIKILSSINGITKDDIMKLITLEKKGE